jgi:hypothetical protein
MASPFELPDDYLRALGRVSSSFSRLEVLVSFSIWNLLGTDQRLAQICTAQVTFKGLLDLLGSLAKERMTETEFLEIRKAIAASDKAAIERNELAHAVWGVGIGTQAGTVSQSRSRASRKGFSYERRPVTAGDLEGVADRIDATCELAGRAFGATLKYAVPTHSLKLCDVALKLAKDESDEAEAIAQLLSITPAIADDQWFKLAQSHCLTRYDYDEAIRKRAAKLLSTALDEN